MEENNSGGQNGASNVTQMQRYAVHCRLWSISPLDSITIL